VHIAEGWEELWLSEIEQQQQGGKDIAFRGDAAFARPEVYVALEERGENYTIRIPANDSQEQDIAELQPRRVKRPSRKPLVEYKRPVLGGELEDSAPTRVRESCRTEAHRIVEVY
jgi:hypothetical protein